MKNLQFAFRVLLKAPVFSAVVIATLALGIGANTAIFTVANAILWQRLPFKNPDRLVQVFGTQPTIAEAPSSPATFHDWKTQNHVFENMVAYIPAGFVLPGADQPERLQGSRVSVEFSALLGVQPRIGRGFLPEEAKPGRDQVVIISDRLWQRHFGGDPKIIGEKLTLDSKLYTVIGVMPAGFWFPNRISDLWTPLGLTAAQENIRDTNFLSVMARLKNEVSIAQAQAEMSGLAQRQARQYPDTNSDLGVKLVSFPETIYRDVRPALLTLFAAAAVVLLIACANVANLFLARAAERRREFAIRSALGASRGSFVRLLLSESLLLSLGGGALGGLLAVWGVDLFAALRPAYVPLLAATGVDLRVFTFLAAVSILSGVVFGLAPVFRLRTDAQPNDLNESSRSATASGSRQRGRQILVAIEIALSAVLLISGGLLIKSFLRLSAVSPGFHVDHVLTLSIALPPNKYPTAAKQASFFHDLLENIRGLPAVKTAGAVTNLPLYGSNSTSFSVEGKTAVANPQRPLTNYDSVSPGFFDSLGIPLLKGRVFTDRDNAQAPAVVVINRTLAQRFFPNENPIGKRIGLSGPPDWREIVGVVGDVRSEGLAADVKPSVYVPFLQNAPDYIAGSSSSMDLAVRTASDPLVVAADLRAALRKLDKDQPITKLGSMEKLLTESIAQERFNTLLLGGFAGLALLLATIGIYGVIAYTVTQRTPELGIRVALGARGADILKLVLRQGLQMTLAGIALGVVCAFVVTRFMSSLLFRTAPNDPATFISLAVLLTVVALIAILIPARRATRVDPMTALRAE